MKTSIINSASVDSDIRRLLLANPSLKMDICKDIINTLEMKTPDEKAELRTWLEENIKVYKSKASEIENQALYLDFCKEAKEHIDLWEDNFGKVSLNDIIFMAESTDINVADIGWKYINPITMKELLDEYLVGQNGYKQELGLCVYSHLLREKNTSLNLPKQNLLVYGPSGVGKTSGIKILADKLKIKIGFVNCNSIVQEGIVGSTIYDAFTRVLQDKYEYMILILDEFDKLFTGNGYYNDRIIQEVLNITDNNNTITFPTTFDIHKEYKQIPSKNITCIMCGKFDKLSEIVKKRLANDGVGFHTFNQHKATIDELYKQVTLNDIKTVLRSDELCGRIGQFARVEQLKTEDLIDILMHKKESVLDKYQTYFSQHNVGLKLTMDGAKEIAKYTLHNYPDLGVRGMESVIRILLKDNMFEISKHKGQTITINKEYVMQRLAESY